MDIGWIKLHRKISDSNMYRSLTSKQRDVLIQCLLLANHDQNEWDWNGQIYRCQKGEFITSLENLAKKCGKDVKVQSVRTALLKLEKWHFLTNKSTKTGRLIKVLNWEKYQQTDNHTNKQTNKQLTKSQQRANKELTTNKNDKNVKNDKNNMGSAFSRPTFPKENYTKITEAYKRIKGVEPKGNEWLPIQQAIRVMFESERTPEQIIEAMGVVNELYEDWTMTTVKMKIADIVAGRLSSNEGIKVLKVIQR